MPKKRQSKKRKAATSKKWPQKHQPKRQSILAKYLWNPIVVFSVVLGICVSLLSLSPNISVVPGQSFNPHDPLSTPFLITNDGLLPLHSVEIFWGSNFMRNPNLSVESLSLGYASPPIKIIHRKEQKTFFCPPIFKWKVPINSADIIIRVLYRPDFLFWRQEMDFRFVAARDISGTVRWLPKPMAEQPRFPN